MCVREYTPVVDTSMTVAADGGTLAGVSVCCVYTECLITSVACALSFRS